ncbi:hypothetical protein ACO0QE_002459 [Hanseniaspora vineae]
MTSLSATRLNHMGQTPYLKPQLNLSNPYLISIVVEKPDTKKPVCTTEVSTENELSKSTQFSSNKESIQIDLSIETICLITLLTIIFYATVFMFFYKMIASPAVFFEPVK